MDDFMTRAFILMDLQAYRLARANVLEYTTNQGTFNDLYSELAARALWIPWSDLSSKLQILSLEPLLSEQTLQEFLVSEDDCGHCTH